MAANKPPVWQRVLARGFWHSFLVSGMLLWGVSFAVLFAGIEYWTGRRAAWLPAALDALPFGLVAGLIFGWGSWGYANVLALRARRREREESDD